MRQRPHGQVWVQTTRSEICRVLKKLNRVTTQPSNSAPGCGPRGPPPGPPPGPRAPSFTAADLQQQKVDTGRLARPHGARHSATKGGRVPTLPAAWTDPGHRGSVRCRTHEATRRATAPTRHVQSRRVHGDRKWAHGRQELRRGRGLPFWKMEGSRNGWGAGCTTVTVLNPT